jgi:hypothetical protein
MERLMREATYSLGLCKRLKDLFPGVIILKNDPDLLQGFPDLTLLYGPYWACLELKGDASAPHQPNQDYYVALLDRMSFSAFIFPENESEVLTALMRVFEPELVH